MHTQLLEDVERCRAEMGLSEHRFGILAAKNGRLIERLRSGGRIWPETEAKIRAFLLVQEQGRKGQNGHKRKGDRH